MNLMSMGASLLGGLGLFLLGMWLMTDGLKLAAGNALREILAQWTRTRTRGLLAGFLVTALVQSSSAVTVATIGFANAGLLTLEQAVWAIFGSNVGTTMTGWIVALIGFKLNVEAMALPLIGVGMLLRLNGEHARRGAVGQALVGFGLLFLGIGALKETFAAIGADIHLPGTRHAGPGTSLLYVLFGMLLTILMQSSSAAMVVTLSAAQGDLITINAAAHVVIGANLGTTTTAMLAVWRATPTARRVAASHVLFNLVTAVVAVAILLPLLGLVAWVQDLAKLSSAPAMTLALFHTAFNFLGVVLMVPLAPRMVRFLEKRFKTAEETAARLQYLDDTVAAVPALALTALNKEILRLGSIARSALQASLSLERPDEDPFAGERETVRTLAAAIGNFVARMGRGSLPPGIANVLPEALRAVQNYSEATELAVEAAELSPELVGLDDEELSQLLIGFRQAAAAALAAAARPGPAQSAQWETAEATLEAAHDSLKHALLRAGATARLSVLRMDALLRQAAFTRRAVRHTLKAVRRLAAIELVSTGGLAGNGGLAAAVLEIDAP